MPLGHYRLLLFLWAWNSLVAAQSPSFRSRRINPGSVSFLRSPRFAFWAILALGLTRPLENQCLDRLDYSSIYVTCALPGHLAEFYSGHIQSTSFTTYFSVESWPLWLLILDYNLPRGESILELRRPCLPSPTSWLCGLGNVTWPLLIWFLDLELRMITSASQGYNNKSWSQ